MANPFDQQKPIEGVRHILAVGSGKGGVGKSTVAANLAIALAAKGHSVGLLDADIYGPSVPRLFGLVNRPMAVNENQKILPHERYGVKLASLGFLVDENVAVVWRGPMLFKAMEQFFRDVIWGSLDYLVIDLPPGTGDVALTMAQKVPVSGGIVVATPQNMALADVKKAVDMFEQVNVPLLGCVENMSGFQTRVEEPPIDLFPRGDLDAFLDSKRLARLTSIPFIPAIAIGSEAGIPVSESDRGRTVSRPYFALAEKVLEGIPDL
jgi:ATP-binding protein involved in chromosome partitioning